MRFATLRCLRHSRSWLRSSRTENKFNDYRFLNGNRRIRGTLSHLHGDVVSVKLNLLPEASRVESRDALYPRFQPLPGLRSDPEPLVDIQIRIQRQSTSMEVERMENLVADHRAQSRVRRVRRTSVPGPCPSRHHGQRDAWN